MKEEQKKNLKLRSGIEPDSVFKIDGACEIKADFEQKAKCLLWSSMEKEMLPGTELYVNWFVSMVGQKKGFYLKISL